MPLKYKIPGYAGNALLLILSLIILAQDSVIVGLLLGALALLNLYLVYKLDMFSHEETFLAHELQVAKMHEELLAAQQRIGELEAGAKAPTDQPEAGKLGPLH
jgi:hypothetical protein